jgi:diguanylate cyclase (GGDEF)-like protein
VEDDELLGTEIQSQLQYLGFSVQLFSDATSARHAISTQQPDAILLDVTLLEGKFGGPELAAFIKDFQAERVPVIFISSRGDWQARLAAVRAGGEAYLTKPIDYMKLLNQLDRVTQRSGKEPYRVLIVDDTAELARHYALILRKAGMQVETLNQPENILKAIANLKPEFIVLDLYMPGVSGMEAANVIRQHQDLLGVPIVFLSTEQDRDIQLRALQNGDFFLQKPISDDHLIATITSRAERARALNALMYRDGLTGLLNHSTLKSQLETEIHRAQRVDSTLCFVMLDLDHFKTVNDTYGHPAGDRVLKGLSRMLKERLRKTDQIGRYGGEEFGVILPDTDQASAMKIMDKIRQHFSALSYTADGTHFHCTFSAGIAQTTSDDNAGTLSKRADEMLYSAKQNGRNTIVASDK